MKRLYTKEQPLCFCEYVDDDGSRNHICLCCCNCDSADKAFDSLCKRNGEFEAHCSSFCRTFDDRCRLPWLRGGAVHLPLDLLLSVLGPPGCLYLASQRYEFSLATVIGMPLALYAAYAVSRLIHIRNTDHSVAGKSSGSKVFFVWTLSSLITTFNLFEMAMFYREINLWENMIIVTLFGFIIWFLYKCKFSEKYFISKGFKGCIGDSYCEICRHVKPEDAGHCSICNECIRGRDHHCVWINECVGRHNHYSFVILLVLVIVSGVYGSLLVMTTLCTPAYLWDTPLLIPVDCRFLYDDRLSALLFVGVCYSLVVVLFAAFLLVQQLILISLGTSQMECHRAAQTPGGSLKFCMIPLHRNRDLGVLDNWRRFCRGGANHSSQYLNV